MSLSQRARAMHFFPAEAAAKLRQAAARSPSRGMRGLRYERTVSRRWHFFSKLFSPSLSARPLDSTPVGWKGAGRASTPMADTPLRRRTSTLSRRARRAHVLPSRAVGPTAAQSIPGVDNAAGGVGHWPRSRALASLSCAPSASYAARIRAMSLVVPPVLPPLRGCSVTAHSEAGSACARAPCARPDLDVAAADAGVGSVL